MRGAAPRSGPFRFQPWHSRSTQNDAPPGRRTIALHGGPIAPCDVGDGEQRLRYLWTDRLGGFEIHRQLGQGLCLLIPVPPDLCADRLDLGVGNAGTRKGPGGEDPGPEEKT
jgi:hypothetical protein